MPVYSAEDSAIANLRQTSKAFASVAMRYMKDLGVEHDVTNVNGGAIAMGHPLGATGAMLVSTMLDELERRKLKRAMLSLCVGNRKCGLSGRVQTRSAPVGDSL